MACFFHCFFLVTKHRSSRPAQAAARSALVYRFSSASNVAQDSLMTRIHSNMMRPEIIDWELTLPLGFSSHACMRNAGELLHRSTLHYTL